MLATVSGASPIFDSMNCWAPLGVFTGSLANVRAGTDKLTTGAMPVPDKPSVCGLLLASSKMLTFAVRLPRLEGVNVTLIVHIALAARVPPHVLLSAKSLLFGPPTSISLTFIAIFPGLCRVTVCTALVVPTNWLP